MEEPVYVKRRHRHRHHHHHRRHCKVHKSVSGPQQPIIIPIQMPEPPAPVQQPLQVTEYVQDIYPPAQVYTDQVPVVCISIVFSF